MVRGGTLRKILLTAVLAAGLAGCSAVKDIPTEFPTPPGPPAVGPLQKAQLRPDADLEKQFAELAAPAKGKVGAMAMVIETGESASLNADGHYPMQSVYKLPIAMAIADECRFGRHDLDEMIRVTPADFVRQGQVSPLRDQHPEGGDFSLRELTGLTIVPSDGTTTDVLLRVMGGTSVPQDFLSRIGITDMRIATTEKEMGADFQAQYKNWATPAAAVELLRWLFAAKDSPDNDAAKDTDGSAYQQVIWKLALACDTGPDRIRGELPKTAVVAHKTGTGGAQDGINSAMNDIGVVEMPNGRHMAIAVFVSDSPADDKTRAAVIAKITKAAWDRWGNAK